MPDTAEELPDLPFPLLQVGPQDRLLLVVSELARGEMLTPPAEEQIAVARCTEVADPLRMPAGRNEVADPSERQRVHGVTPRLAALAPPHLENT